MSVRFLHPVLLAALLLCCSRADAQSVDPDLSQAFPDRQFGFGIDSRGGHFQYAFGPGFHAGVRLNAARTSDYCYNGAELSWDLGVYARLLVSTGPIRPYVSIEASNIEPARGPYNCDYVDEYHAIDHDFSTFAIALGGEHFVNRHVGLYGQVAVTELRIPQFMPSIHLGLLGGLAGVEFFF